MKKEDRENEWLVNDRPVEYSQEVLNMTKEELEEEFERIYGEYIRKQHSAPTST